MTLRPFALAILSGVLYFLGFVGFDQAYLAWICLVPLLFALQGAGTWKRALALSWCMGFVTHLGGYYWVVHLLSEFALLSLPLSVLGYLLLCAFQSGVLALAGLLAWAVSRRTGWSLGATVPLALMAAELSYPLIFQSYTANSQAWVPAVTQIVDLGGPLLLTGLIALVNGAIYELASAALARRRLPWKLPAGAAAAVIFTLVYGAVRMGTIADRDEAAPKLKTAIVQANVGAADKHEHVWEGIQRYRDMTDAAMRIPGIGLVVWPESALNRMVLPHVKSLGADVATAVRAPMIVGALRAALTGEHTSIWNTAFALDEHGDISGHYDKVVRLIFGEYIPGDTIFPKIYDLLPFSSHFDPGQSLEPLPVGPYRIAPDICYEDILPMQIRDVMRPIDEKGTRPHALVNVTNDSWYGPAEPPIHLALSTFRAIEERRWLIRSTATGISAFIDSAGRIVEKGPFEQAATLVHDVPMPSDGPTVYGRIGNLVGWLSLVACVVPLVRKRRPASPAARARQAA